MKNNIGIVGYGVIGQATHQALLSDQAVKIHDLSLQSRLQDLFDCDLIFVCTPTGNVQDFDNIKEIIHQLTAHNPAVEIVIRSTVIPGFFSTLPENVTYLPEFLRERCAVSDAKTAEVMLYATRASHSKLTHFQKFSHKLKRMDIAELEILKLMVNNYRAMKVVFANHFYDLCCTNGADYDHMLSVFANIKNGQSYMEVREDLRGYSGKCLPKDIDFAIDIFPDSNLFTAIKQDNSKWKPTTRIDL